MTDTMHISTQTKADQIYEAFCNIGMYNDTCEALGIACTWSLAEGASIIQCAQLARIVGSTDDRFDLTVTFPSGYEYRAEGRILRSHDGRSYAITNADGRFDRYELVCYVTSHAAAHHLHGERRPDWLRCFREIS